MQTLVTVRGPAGEVSCRAAARSPGIGKTGMERGERLLIICD
ncbi:hypothetical protein P3T29_005949 [Kitasatospora sp. MAP5-34]|nr:hypothetical protein [Kitasatospora sp. MAP5-34]